METYVAVAEMKNHLSEYISRSAYNHDRFIITKRDKPVAALVNLEDLQALEQLEERKGLASVIGQWQDFEEVEAGMGDIRKLRENHGEPREVSL